MIVFRERDKTIIRSAFHNLGNLKNEFTGVLFYLLEFIIRGCCTGIICTEMYQKLLFVAKIDKEWNI